VNKNDLTKMVLIALINEMGGIIKLDARKMLDDLKAGIFTDLAIKIEGDELIAEVFTLDEN